MTMIFVDIDHTLSAAWHRDHLIPENDYWSDEVSDAYHNRSIEDAPISEIIALVQSLGVIGWHKYALTARPEKYRAITQVWLAEHVPGFDGLLMRKEGDTRPSHLVKEELIKPYLENRTDPVILLDDRADVCDYLSHIPLVTIMRVKAAKR